MNGRPKHNPDWQDTHSGPVAPQYKTARQSFEAGFASLPGWVSIALRLRDAVVKRFGLTTVSEGDLNMTSLPVLQETPTTYEVGLEDKHLTFTLLTQQNNNNVSVTTRIWFNHWLGRVYLAAVLLPHKIIVRHAVRALT